MQYSMMAAWLPDVINRTFLADFVEQEKKQGRDISGLSDEDLHKLAVSRGVLTQAQ